MQKITDILWDVVVIGGGPAGMMAAGTAASLGKKVLLLEKNDGLGKKLLITGGGRCNLTNNEPDVRKFLSKFKESDQFLFSAFSQYSVTETLDFFHSKNMETKVEAGLRVFPKSNSAKSVWEVLLNYMKEGAVTIQSNSPVTGFVTENKEILGVTLNDKNVIKGKSFVLATGGKSRPQTGSTGEGFEWLREIGHSVVESTASLVPIAVKTEWVKRLQGVSIDDVKVTILQNELKQDSKRGKILFTHFGLSGPTILNMSHDIGEQLKYGDVELSLDLLPNLDYGQLNQRLQDIFKENINKKFKNTLDTLVPSAVAPIIVELSKINPDTPAHSVTREERLSLIQLLKNINIEVDELLGVDKAIITSGGISLDEVDFKTMSSRLFCNLYLVGDVLNINRPTGGYGLQLCWTTGHIAGINSAKQNDKN
jgi:predicted Rossmann fold flavoprotein